SRPSTSPCPTSPRPPRRRPPCSGAAGSASAPPPPATPSSRSAAARRCNSCSRPVVGSSPTSTIPTRRRDWCTTSSEKPCGSTTEGTTDRTQRVNRRAWLAVTALLALTAACGPAEGPGVDDTVPGDDAVHYVALGDSYTAAPGTGEPVGTPRGCGRSDNNYPRLLADRLAPESFTDVSCGGATTEHLTAPQRTPDGTNPPQLDAVTPKTTLVTVGIGGNDVGFVELANRCASAAEEGLRCSDAVAGGDGTLNA